MADEINDPIAWLAWVQKKWADLASGRITETEMRAILARDYPPDEVDIIIERFHCYGTGSEAEWRDAGRATKRLLDRIRRRPRLR